MRKWLIKLLGGKTQKDVDELAELLNVFRKQYKDEIDRLNIVIGNLNHQLQASQKNDKRDPKTGRFTK